MQQMNLDQMNEKKIDTAVSSKAEDNRIEVPEAGYRMLRCNHTMYLEEG